MDYFSIFLLTFWGAGSLSFVCDIFYPEKRFFVCEQILLLRQYKEFLSCVLMNLFVWLPFFCLPTLNWLVTFSTTPPVTYFVLFQFIWLSFWFEVLFWINHRLLHIPIFFQWIHSKHHKMVHPIGIGGLYCHPVELFCSNYLPFALPVVTIPEGIIDHVLYLWSALAGLYIIISHSGYSFPYKIPRHLFHHQFINRNYGTMGFMDRITNTFANTLTNIHAPNITIGTTVENAFEHTVENAIEKLVFK